MAGSGTLCDAEWLSSLNIGTKPSHLWSATLVPPIAQALPPEILQQIFYYLPPIDFESARRACTGWFYASLSLLLQKAMARRAGWSSCFGPLEHPQALCFQISERLAREAALSPRLANRGIGYEPSSADAATTPVSHTACISLHSLPNGTTTLHPTPSSCNRFLLLTLGCTIYIYALSHTDSILIPVTSIIAPRRVLATSMDTSAGRFAVAALLDNRVGMVCELDDLGPAPPPSPGVYAGRARSIVAPDPLEGTTGTAVATVTSTQHGFERIQGGAIDGGEVNVIHIRSPTQQVQLFNASMNTQSEQTWLGGSLPLFGNSSRGGADITSQLPRSPPRPYLLNDTPTNGATPPIPIHPGALNLYPHICSPQDLPRTVAICPSRRCVAFGCAAGVELHWVDARGGRNLMKWFPLTAPSEVLAFLPWRKGVDVGNRLRLVSSVDLPSVSDREGSEGGSLALMRGWEGVLGARGRVWRALRRWGWDMDPNADLDDDGNTVGDGIMRRRDSASADADGFDHYKAIPLADGTHLLFVDPGSRDLMLGCDAPHAAGTARLLRKVRFVPPPSSHFNMNARSDMSSGSPPDANVREDESADDSTRHRRTGTKNKTAPTAYAASRDLSRGVRVVAAYGDVVVLYTIPPDVFKDLERVTGRTVEGPNGFPRFPDGELVLRRVEPGVEHHESRGEQGNRARGRRRSGSENGSGWGEWCEWWDYEGVSGDCQEREHDDGVAVEGEGESAERRTVKDLLPLRVEGVVVGLCKDVEAVVVASVGEDDRGDLIPAATGETEDSICDADAREATPACPGADRDDLVVWAFGEGGRVAVAWRLGIEGTRSASVSVTRKVVREDGSIIAVEDDHGAV